MPGANCSSSNRTFARPVCSTRCRPRAVSWAAVATRARGFRGDGHRRHKSGPRQSAALAARERRDVRCARRPGSRAVRGASTCSRCCSTPPNGACRAWIDAAHALVERTLGRSLRNERRSRKVCCRPASSSATRSSCGRARACRCATDCICTSSRSISRARPMAVGGSERPHAGTLGSGLHAREPRGFVAMPSRALLPKRTYAPRELSRFTDRFLSLSNRDQPLAVFCRQIHRNRTISSTLI